MRLADIHFHDAELLRVVETASAQELRWEVMYPVDWEKDEYEKRTIVFSEVTNYEVREGLFVGHLSLLAFNVLHEDGGRTKVRIETTAGYRQFEFGKVQLNDALSGRRHR